MIKKYKSVIELIESMDLPEDQKKEQIDYINAREPERKAINERIRAGMSPE